MASQSPYEQIRFIADAIKDRQDKNQQTFFNVKLERFGALTPLAVREPGANFYETVIQYLTRYDLTALIVELYSGKSHNVKEPFQTIRINIKRGAEISGLSLPDEPKLSPTENVITTEKHFFSMAEKERQVMLLEFDIKRLQYENEELKKKNKKKKRYIQELEAELGKVERDKKNSFGNVSLGLVGANALEGFVKSEVGTGLLKGLFGAKPEMLEGVLGSQQSPPTKEETPESKSTASIIAEEKKPLSKEEKIRQDIKTYIYQFLDASSDTTLRLYYELMLYLGADNKILASVLENVKQYRQSQKSKDREQTNGHSLGQDSRPSHTPEQDEQFNDSS